jgi:basic membrane protein A and related proteins
MNRRPGLWALLVLVVGLLALAGCGSDEEETTGAGTTAEETGGATTEAAGGNAIRIGLVTDIGGLDDRSFNFLANRGLEQAERELGVDGRVVISRSNADYVPNLTTLARQGYDLVIAVGFLMADALDVVAKRFPDVNFAIIDYPQEELASKPKNVRGLLFKEQEAGYLVGYLAGLVVKEDGGSNPTISSVGGQKIPPVDRYIAGYQAGAEAASPGTATLNGYSQDFVDQAKCKEIALAQIARGATVVFQVAGQCGLGALSAAKERNVWGIGVDADQSFLGNHILTSALKKVDVAVFQTIQEVDVGSFSGGENSVFDVASGGVGFGEVSSDVPSDLVSQLNQVQDNIADGKISDIPDTVGS